MAQPNMAAGGMVSSGRLHLNRFPNESCEPTGPDEQSGPIARIMPSETTIAFAGPFSWSGTLDAPAVCAADEARKAGIYLWTVPLPEGHLVYYVGETGRRFDVRLHQHHEELVAARYHIYSAAEFARGEKLLLWPGRFDRTNRKSDEDCRANCARLSDQIREMMLVLRFFFAPLSCDKRMRQRIEASIAQSLYATAGVIGAFQDKGIRYWPRTNDEQAIACVVSSPVRLLGLPERFGA